jgi:hypothetical protein
MAKQLTDEEREKLAAFANHLLSDPKTRKQALKLAKERDPNFTHVELEIDDRMEAVRTENAQTIEKLQNDIQERDLASQRRAIEEKLSKDGFEIADVEKVMTENRIGSYDTAVKFMQQERRLAAPSPASTTRMTLPTDVKDIMKNPTQWARDQAHKIIDEAKVARR